MSADELREAVVKPAAAGYAVDSILAVASADTTAKLVGPRRPASPHTARITAAITGSGVRPDAPTLAVLDQAGTVTLWDVSKPSAPHTVALPVAAAVGLSR